MCYYSLACFSSAAPTSNSAESVFEKRRVPILEDYGYSTFFACSGFYHDICADGMSSACWASSFCDHYCTFCLLTFSFLVCVVSSCRRLLSCAWSSTETGSLSNLASPCRSIRHARRITMSMRSRAATAHFLHALFIGPHRKDVGHNQNADAPCKSNPYLLRHWLSIQ